MLAFKSKFRNYKPKPIKPSAAYPQKPWSKYQLAIFDNVKNGSGHTAIQAGPGSAKSTTICASLWHLPEELQRDNRVLYTAFNTAIAKELESKVLSSAVVKNHHALGFQTVRPHWGMYGIGNWGCVDQKNDSLFELAIEQVGASLSLNRLRQMLVKSLDYCKTTLADSPEQIEDVIDEYGIDLCGLSQSEFSTNIIGMLNKCKEAPRVLNSRSVITFGDMIWLPHVNGWDPVVKYDVIYVDEAQDLSNARTELLLNSLKPGGRFIICYDKFQAIYHFAGASTTVIDKLTKDLNAKQLPLSVSYRCAKSIIELAKEINPMIEAAPGAIDGIVDSIYEEEIFDVAVPGSVILSRTNWPLIKLCYKMLSMGINVNIHGKDVGDRFLWRIDSWTPESVQALVNSINTWRDDVCDRLNAKRQNTSHIVDEAKSLELFTNGAQSVSEVKDRVKSFFNDEDAQVKLSSCHKFKGLERNKVLMLLNTFHPNDGGEETNIYYTAITRAKNHLTFVNN